MKHLIKTTALAIALLGSSSAMAKSEKYTLDPTHSFVQFKASHLGFSWLLGRFNELEGELMYDDENVANSSIKVKINTQSLDSNHAKRDKHLKSPDYIDAEQFPEATFSSTSVSKKGEDLIIKGNLTFHGMTKELVINAKEVGAGKDPWGGFRRGYEGTAMLHKSMFGMRGKAGAPDDGVELRLFIEAIK